MQKRKSLKPAAALSSSLLRGGRAKRDAGGSRPVDKEPAPDIAAPPAAPLESAAIPEPSTTPEPPAASEAEALKPGKPPLDLDAFDGTLSDLLAEETGAPQSEAPAEAGSGGTGFGETALGEPVLGPDGFPIRMLDQFECLRARKSDGVRRTVVKAAPEASEAETPEAAVPGRDAPAEEAPAVEDIIATPEEESAPAADAGFEDPGAAKALLDDFLGKLREGRFKQAERDFGQIMNLDLSQAKRILHKAELEDLAVICRALGLRALEFATIVALLRGAKANGGFSPTDGLKGSLGIFSSVDRDHAVKLMEYIPELPQRDWSSLTQL